MRADNFPDPDRPRKRFGLFRKRADKGDRAPRRAAKPDSETVKVIERFLTTRTGVEAYVEPETPTAPLSIVLVAADGEWIRQRIPDPNWLQKISKAARLPVYEVSRVGYPKRMRDYRRPARDEGPESAG